MLEILDYQSKSVLVITKNPFEISQYLEQNDFSLFKILSSNQKNNLRTKQDI
jgi:hypothetical protein